MATLRYQSIALAMLPLLPAIALTQPQSSPWLPPQGDIRQTVRDYLAIPYAMQLTVLVQAAKSGQGQVDAAAIKQPMADALSMQISLSGITTGKTADIQNQAFTNFVTVPDPSEDIVHLTVLKPALQNHEKFGSITAAWGPLDKQQDTSKASDLTLEQLFTQLSDLYATTFTRYVAYTVMLQYQGRSVNYKALYLFSDDPLKYQIVDLFLNGSRYSNASAAYRPDLVLISPLRNIPAIHDWMLSHTTDNDQCGEMNQLCCLNGQCSLRRKDFDRKMNYHIPQDDIAPPPPPVGTVAVPPAGTDTAAQPLDQKSHRARMRSFRKDPDVEGHIMRVGLPRVHGSKLLNLSDAWHFQNECSPDSPDTCACDIDYGCTPLPAPYSTNGSASCMVNTHNREVYILYLVPTGMYHNWIVTVVHAPGYTNDIEIFDGGPSGQTPYYLQAYADLPPEGHQSGDTSSGTPWAVSGFSTANCLSVQEIQSYTQFFPEAYYLYDPVNGPNSNSYAYTAIETTDLGPYWYAPSQPSPGWGEFLE